MLLGGLVAAAAPHLGHVAIDPEDFTALTGGSAPTIWQELGGGARGGVVAAAVILLALCFRPSGRLWDRVGAGAGVALGGAMIAGAMLARRAAAADAGVLRAALEAPGGSGGGAGPGGGFWVLLAGAVLVAGAAVWDLVEAWWRREKVAADEGSPEGDGASGEDDATVGE